VVAGYHCGTLVDKCRSALYGV